MFAKSFEDIEITEALKEIDITIKKLKDIENNFR